jgi:hypothetical protein
MEESLGFKEVGEEEFDFQDVDSNAVGADKSVPNIDQEGAETEDELSDEDEKEDPTWDPTEIRDPIEGSVASEHVLLPSSCEGVKIEELAGKVNKTDNVYDVERIIEKKIRPDGLWQFFVKWVGGRWLNTALLFSFFFPPSFSF